MNYKPSLPASKSTAAIMAGIGFFLVLLPKINLVSVENQSAGLRIDDFVISLLFAGVIGAILQHRTLPTYSRAANMYLLFCIYSLCATSFDIYFYGYGNILYPIRLIEYFIFFIVGYNCSHKKQIAGFLTFFLCLNILVSTLQLKGIIGGFGSEGFSSEASDRPFGTTGGPWELAAIANLAFVFFAFESRDSKKIQNLLIGFLATTFIIIITKSRIALLAHVVAVIMLLRHRGNSLASILIPLFFVATFSYLVILFNILGGVGERSESLFSLTNLYAFQDMYEKLGSVGKVINFPDIQQLSDADTSWLIRVAKWAFAFKFWASSWLYILIGVGAGAWGVALDGGLLRLFTENGIIGGILYFAFMRSAVKQGSVSFALTVMLFINMLMIDIYIAYKFMATLLILLGYTAREREYS